MEEGLLPSQMTIHMQPTIQELPIDERGSFSRSIPSPEDTFSSAVQSVLNFLGAY